MADELEGEGKNKVFVAGLPWKTTERELRELVESCGRIVEAKIMLDRETGRSKGIASVEMSSAAEAQAVIRRLNGSVLAGRKLFAAEFKPKAGPEQAGRRPPEPSAPRTVPGPPGGVERRSGQDRRKNPGFGGPAPERREFKKPWAKKPWSREKPGAGGIGPWEKKPWDRDRKPAFGDRKPWDKDRKPSFGDRKPWDKDRKPSFGDRKPWDKDRKPPFGDRKPWNKDKGPGDAKPWGKKPFAKRPFGKKPGGFRRPEK